MRARALRQVTAQAPLRISFAGGGTDSMPYSGEHGGRVLSATIGLFARARVGVGPRLPGPSGDTLPSASQSAGPGAAAFDIAWELLGRPGEEPPPYRTCTAGLSGSGLGTSSAAIVALLAALAAWCGRDLDRGELARLAYHVERERLAQAGGAQDHYSAAFGGVNLIEFGADGAGLIMPQHLDPGTWDRLERSLLLCDTGRRRAPGEVTALSVPGAVQTQALHRLKALALDMRDLLAAGNVDGFGERMGVAWEQKLTLCGGSGETAAPGMQDAARLLDAGLAAGAMSGRLLGAPGGGFLLFFVPPPCRRAVAAALANNGGTPLPVRLCGMGAVVERAQTSINGRNSRQRRSSGRENTLPGTVHQPA
jgi:D-glycero-alpha-D-manno-heptose-7-phosphate kinase